MDTPLPVLVVRTTCVACTELPADVMTQAGAGPTGLVLGLTLLQCGIRVRVVDKDSNRHPGQRGAGLQVSVQAQS